MSYKPDTTLGMFVALAIFYFVTFISAILLYIWAI